jgi:hypothetical protein
MMPVPTHLRNIVVPREEVVDEELLIGDVRCRCGSGDFSLMYPGSTQEYEGKVYACTAEIDGNFFFLVKAVCAKCCAEYTLFDKHFHGWDGFLCHNPAKAALPRPPLTDWKCLSCGSMNHKVVIKVSSQGKDDFIGATEGEFDEENWPDAFEWIWMTITCCECGLVTENWVDYETA